MNEQLLARLLRSTQSALPLETDFWGTLAHGMRASIDELGTLLATLQDAGACLGARLEPSPIMPGATECLLLAGGAPQASVPRWAGAGPGGVPVGSILAFEAPTGSPATRFFKAGRMLHPELADAAHLLAPERDRTTRLHPDEPAPSAAQLDPEAGRLAGVLMDGFPLLPPHDPWRILGEQAGIEPAAVVPALKRLILSRAARRFAFHFVPPPLGWQGVAFALWLLPEGTDGIAAAETLAGMAGFTEVALRTHEGAPALTALVLGREPGSGVGAAIMAAERTALGPPAILHDVDLVF